VARLPLQGGGGGSSPTRRLHFTEDDLASVNMLLAAEHYLGPIRAARYVHAGWLDDVLVAAMVWRWPTARMLPADGSWLELSRWCISSAAPKNTGSRMMGWAARTLRARAPQVETLVSYSDPSQGHVGALYKASGWIEAPTHHTLRY